MIPFYDEATAMILVLLFLLVVYTAWEAGRRSGRSEVFNPKRSIRRTCR